MIKKFLKISSQHPLAVLYGTLLGITAFWAACPMFSSGMWDAALVDLIMAGVLSSVMLKKFIISPARHQSSMGSKYAAWAIMLLADILALMPANDFSGSLIAAFAFSMLIFAFVLYFSGIRLAAVSALPALWCCVFMPYHAEIMLLFSFPLRLSATMFSACILNLCHIHTVYSGTSLILPGLDISITDACSGINQLDAFILVAFIAVRMMHGKVIWQILHFAFIMPSIIIGNSLRIVLTVLLYRMLGESVLYAGWHTALGYIQIILAIMIFLVIGWIFRKTVKYQEEVEQC